MRIDSNIPPTTPFHLARAYNAQPVEPVSNRVVTTAVDPIARIGREQHPNTTAGDDSIRRLVGAVVPGGVNFDEAGGNGSAAVSRDTYAMYRRPTDRNDAATGVHVGRALDVSA